MRPRRDRVARRRSPDRERGGLFAWLFGGARGGGADDEEESSGQETLAGARAGRGGGAPMVQIADAGPDAVARAKRDLPTGPAYAGPSTPAAPAPAAAPTTKRAAAPKPQVVAALEQPNVESDAGDAAPLKVRSPIAALYLAPMPPRRPSDLAQQIAGASFPLPPISANRSRAGCDRIDRATAPGSSGEPHRRLRAGRCRRGQNDPPGRPRQSERVAESHCRKRRAGPDRRAGVGRDARRAQRRCAARPRSRIDRAAAADARSQCRPRRDDQGGRARVRR